MKHTQALRRFGSHKKRPPGEVWALAPTHPAVVNAQPLFPSRVVAADISPRLLVSGHNNRKIGKRVMKGEWAGMPIFTVTLAERATCPRACAMWEGCYGNSMHWARRHEHGKDFEEKLEREVAEKDRAHPNGFVVRLHVLGDFYSVAYVELWKSLAERHAGLHIFGYTARTAEHDGDIYGAIAEANQRYQGRVAIRFSGTAVGPMRAVVLHDDMVPDTVIVCPAATHQSECCATCGLCWSPAAKTKTIGFPLHGGSRVRA